jgi:hypothetical protein
MNCDFEELRLNFYGYVSKYFGADMTSEKD